MRRRIVLLLAVGSLGACTSVTGITPTADGHLAVTCFARWDLVSWNHVRKTGVRHANAYCGRHHKEMHEIDVHSKGLRGVTRQSVEVVFDCI